MWDFVIAIGNLILLPSLLPTLLDSRSYVPRITSGFAVIGLSFVVVGLVGEGFVISPILTSTAALLWAFIFLFRGKPTEAARSSRHPPTDVGRNRREKAIGLIVLGLIIASVAGSISLATYVNSSEVGGAYVILWGAVAFGALMFIRGLVSFFDR